MRSRFLRKEIPLFTILALVISASAFASGNIIYDTQGEVTAVNFGQKILTLSETNFFWTRSTLFCDAKEVPIEIKRVKPKSWVYIVCEYDTKTKKRTAQKVYLLPNRIAEKDKHLYPFME